MQPLIVPGRLDSLEKIRKYVLQAAKNADLEKSRAYKLSLAVDEIATNIINYGYQRAGIEGDILVEADLDEHSLTITLDDTGGYFDPTLKPPPPPEDFTQPLGERAIGGWGVYLAIQSVDQFHYQRFDEHNKNIFTMYRATHGDLLVIDSFQDSCTSISQHLTSLGYTVTCVENGQKALVQMHHQKYEMVLLGLPMLESSAEEFIKEMKADNALRSIPVLILVVPENLEEAERCIKSGAEDLIILPFRPVVLEARVSAILERLRVRIAEQTIKDTMKYERDRQIGRMIQLFFLPEMLPQPPGWEIAASFTPGREVTGDFYDSFILPNHDVSLIMGDVHDKGITAALFMVLFRSLLRAYTQQDYTDYLNDPLDQGSIERSGSERRDFQSVSRLALKKAVELTNNFILNNHESKKRFATIFFGILDPISGILIYINAGFEPPLIINHAEKKTYLKPTGSAVGMTPDVDYKIQQIQLDPGDTLLIYSNGVIEAKNPSDQTFGRKRILGLVENASLSATDLLSRIETNLQDYIGEADQLDDFTMLAVRRPA